MAKRHKLTLFYQAGSADIVWTSYHEDTIQCYSIILNIKSLTPLHKSHRTPHNNISGHWPLAKRLKTLKDTNFLYETHPELNIYDLSTF